MSLELIIHMKLSMNESILLYQKNHNDTVKKQIVHLPD